MNYPIAIGWELVGGLDWLFGGAAGAGAFPFGAGAFPFGEFGGGVVTGGLELALGGLEFGFSVAGEF